MELVDFRVIHDRAAERKGGHDALRALMPGGIRAPAEIEQLGDDRLLAAITRCIFRAGFVWKVIDNKWPGFEQAFWQFNVMRCAMISAEDMETLGRDERIVRNMQKITTVPHNAVMILDAQKSHGSFARLVAHWPGEDLVGLLQYLKKQGARLGGNSAQYFLRTIGKDGFVLSRDVVAALTNHGVIDGPFGGKAAMARIQGAFNQWHQQTGLGYAEISRILSMSVD